MALTLSKAEQLQQQLENHKLEQSVTSNELAKNPNDPDALLRLMQVQETIKATEKALGAISSAVQAFNATSAAANHRAFLNDAVASRAAVQAALNTRQTAAAAADAALDALATALDQMAAASATGMAAFAKWRAGLCASSPRAGQDPWETGLGFTHTDLHMFAPALAQKLDAVLRTRMKTHPYILFNFQENKNNTFALVNANARDSFDSVSSAYHSILQKAAASA